MIKIHYAYMKDFNTNFQENLCLNYFYRKATLFVQTLSHRHKLILYYAMKLSNMHLTHTPKGDGKRKRIKKCSQTPAASTISLYCLCNSSSSPSNWKGHAHE